MPRVLVVMLMPCVASVCDKEPPEADRGPYPPPPLTIAAPRPIATRAAFDLVATEHGGLLVWGRPSALGGGLRVLALDPEGGVKGADGRVVSTRDSTPDAASSMIPPQAIEIAVAAGGGRVGVVWVRQNQLQLDVRAAVGNDSGAFGPPQQLGSTQTGSVGTRGAIAVAASPNGAFRALSRLGTGSCESGHARCGRFAVFRLRTRARAKSTKRRNGDMSVPEPCTRGAVGFAYAGQSWYYAVCSQAGESMETTVFGIKPSTSYAHSEQIMRGCAPQGVTAMGVKVFVAADCQDRRHAVVLSDAGRRVGPALPLRRQVECREGRPVVQLHEGQDLVLSAPRSGLSPLLPPRVAPAGSRAVWTGRAILVGVPIGREVALRRYGCADGRFRRLDIQ